MVDRFSDDTDDESPRQPVYNERLFLEPIIRKVLQDGLTENEIKAFLDEYKRAEDNGELDFVFSHEPVWKHGYAALAWLTGTIHIGYMFNNKKRRFIKFRLEPLEQGETLTMVFADSGKPVLRDPKNTDSAIRFGVSYEAALKIFKDRQKALLRIDLSNALQRAAKVRVNTGHPSLESLGKKVREQSLG